MSKAMRTASFILATGAVLSAAWGWGRAQRVNTPPKYLLTDKSLVLLTAPQLVAGPVVLDAKWSPDGVRVAAIRRTERLVLDRPVNEMRLVLWSKGRQSHEIWQREMDIENQPHVAWISPAFVTVEMQWSDRVQTTDAGGRSALVPTLHQGILWVDVTREEVRTIETRPGDLLYVSPSQPCAVLFSSEQHSLSVMKPDGNVLKKIPLPEKAVWTQYHQAEQWSPDGLHVSLTATEPGLGSPPEQVFKTYRLNVQTGVLDTENQPEAAARKIRPAALRLVQTDQEVKFGRRTQRLHPLWLESATGGEQPAALLAADSTGGTLGATGEAVLYLSEQAAWVTPLHIGPKEPFVTNLKLALQSNAKQLGLAMRMYSQDYDETLPSADIGIQGALRPYHKSDGLYDGFNYTFPGGALPSGDALAGTQFGSIDGPGGQWIIYGDGHVGWKPN